jgi:hypothetical protein
MYKSLGLVCFLIAAVAQAVEIPRMPAAGRPAPGPVVNCNNGESIQAAVDAIAGPAEIRISGICVENVVIRNKDVSLRGTQQPSLDGIRSVDPGTPALTVRGTVIAGISDLSFSESAGRGLMIRDGARVDVTNCLLESNGTTGLFADSGAFVRGDGLTLKANPSANAIASDAQFFCFACDFSGGGAAAVSVRGSIVSLLDSTVTGEVGIVADQINAYVDLDCVSADTPHPCSMNVTGPAAIGTFSGTAVLFGTGNFTGQLIADDRGTVRLNGAVQRLTSGNGQPNIVDHLGEIIVAPLLDVSPPAQSVLRGTAATHFGRVLLTGNAVLNGPIQCTGAADAFLDPTVTRSPGSSVTGCANGNPR